ncbi:phosphate ABC transporter permease PstA [Halocatena halophila]|uniref:phosphate ABC transporter permease PstA n=1 Tax=Halocatena halophila TaxID=2814576 RepID=UPI002ED2D0CC
MATDHADNTATVSRTRGIVFRYVLLVATLSALASLGLLLANVAVDAFAPFSADPSWYLVYLCTLVLPTLLVGWVLRRHELLVGGIEALFVPIGGLFGAGALFLLFEVLPFNVWFAWAVGIAVPLAIWLLSSVAGTSGRLRAGLTLIFGGVSLFGLPLVDVSTTGVLGPLVMGLPAYIQLKVYSIPNYYLTYLLTLALPVALLVGHQIRKRESFNAGLAATGLVAIASLSVLFQTVVYTYVALVLVVTVLVPAAWYWYTQWRDRPDDRLQFAFPATVLIGAGLGRLAIWALSISGPNSWVDLQFLQDAPTRYAESAGLNPALVGSLLLMVVVIATAFPLGVGAAVYLEEYAPDNGFTRLIQLNISNLAGVPSVVYGLLGLGLFINLGGMSGETISLFGRTITLSGMPTGSVLVGGLAISLLILPIVIISSQEAIRSVPDSLRQASFGMGATRWQTVKHVVLPRSIPGILTGTILAVGRAVGETAPLIMVLAASYSSSPPGGLLDKATALPLQVYSWAFEPDPAFRHGVLAAGVVVMIVVLLVINSIAIIVRNKYEARQQ